MALVSSGQITIVDNNDAKQVIASLVSSGGLQQIYKSGDIGTFAPDFYTNQTTITASVYRSDPGGATEICGTLTNRKFTIGIGGSTIDVGAPSATTSSSFGNATGVTLVTPNDKPFSVAHTSGSQSTLIIKGNILNSVGQYVIGFEGDYTDLSTGLITHVLTSITFSTIVTGTDASYVLFRGIPVIEDAVGTLKNFTALSADFYRGGAGLDVTGLTYKWYETVSGALTQITTATTGYSLKYGMKTVANPTLPTISPTEFLTLTANVPATTAAVAYNTLCLSEQAVLNTNTYKVEVFDSAGATPNTPIAVGYQTVNDVSDMYRVSVISSTGDKLPNGAGNTSLTPFITYGGNTMSAATDTGYGAWNFIWYLTNRLGKRAAFIDTTRTAYAAGRSIIANGTGTSATIQYGGVAISIVAGDVIKVVSSNNVDSYYEVASVNVQTITIRTPVTNALWLKFTDFPEPTQQNDPLLLNGGKFYVCTTPQAQTAAVTASIAGTATTTTITGLTTGNIGNFFANQILTKTAGTGAFGGITKVVSVDTVNLTLTINSTTTNSTGSLSFTAAAPVGTFTTIGTAAILVTGDDIDAKGVITIEANKP